MIVASQFQSSTDSIKALLYVYMQDTCFPDIHFLMLREFLKQGNSSPSC